MPIRRRAIPFNPFVEVELRRKGWRIALDFISDGTEAIDWATRTFWLDVREWGGDRLAAAAHALAHLVLDHHKLDAPTEQHERDAEDLAALWLDTTEGAAMIINVNSI